MVYALYFRVKQQAPSWLPGLEKHDIPIVVGVGVSLAFIFITVSFYSLFQKNGPAPTSRAGQISATTSDVSTPMSNSEVVPQATLECFWKYASLLRDGEFEFKTDKTFKEHIQGEHSVKYGT